MNNDKRWKRVLLRTLSYVLVAAITAAATYFLTAVQNWKQMSKLERLETVIEEFYIDDYDRETVEDAAAAAMVNALGNRWSYYISESEYSAYVDSHANSYVGIGITIVCLEDGTGFEVIQVEENGGAQIAGMQPGDIITGVEGQTVEELGAQQASQMIQGEEGTKVSLTVVRDGQTQELEVERMQIQITVATAQMLPDDIGLITIVNFNERSASETIACIEQLIEEGATALIFDVRFNPGGYKDEMVKVLDYLLPEGKLFCSVDYKGNEEIDRSDSKCLEMPMAVLINEDSYSAAEFFAAALQEYEWATVVGTPSTGKSQYQITIPLDDGSAVNLSVGEYFTPNGVSLADEGGLQPDIKVEVDDATYKKIYYGQMPVQEDPQIAAAAEVLKNGK